MTKKHLLLSGLLIIPTILVGCDVFKSDKEIVLSAIENYQNTNQKNLNSSFDFPHTNDWSFDFLNNSTVAFNKSFVGENFDSKLIASYENSAVKTTLDVHSRNNKIYVSSNSLLEQIGGELTPPKDKSLSDFEDKFISDFNATDFEKLNIISSVPIEGLLSSSESLPKDIFSEIKEPEINTPYKAYSIALTKKTINDFFPDLAEQDISSMKISIYIDEGIIKNSHYTITSDFNNDSKEEELFVFNEFNTNKTNLVTVKDTISLNDFITAFSLKKLETNNESEKENEGLENKEKESSPIQKAESDNKKEVPSSSVEKEKPVSNEKEEKEKIKEETIIEKESLPVEQKQDVDSIQEPTSSEDEKTTDTENATDTKDVSDEN